MEVVTYFIIFIHLAVFLFNVDRRDISRVHGVIKLSLIAQLV